jgi:predicted extracellular nuclease
MTATYFRVSDGQLRQDWTDTGLIAANDQWSGVPSIEGFLGEDLTSQTGADPRGLSGSSRTQDVIANQTNPNTLSNGGVAEFGGSNPTVALNGSGSADAPYLALYLDTTDVGAVRLSFNLRDLDGSADNAVQPVAVQYRLGDQGDWANIEGGYVEDASTGPNLADKVTPVSVTLPDAALNQAEVQVRVITANAVGNDEWIGIDDILVTAADVAPPPKATVSVAALEADRAEGDAGTTTFTFQVTRSSAEGEATLRYALLTPGGEGQADAADFGGTLPMGEVRFAAGETTATVTIDVSGDTLAEADESFQLALQEAPDGLAITGGPATATIRNDDFTVSRISEIQGRAASSGFVGRTVTVEAIVVGDFQNGDADSTRSLSGFYLQEEGADEDGDAATSEGIFVFQGSLPGDVALGDRVRVTGTVSEYFGQTQISPTAVQVMEAGAVADIDAMAVAVNLPAAGVSTAQDGGYQADLEAYEGMLVRLPQTMTVTEQFNLDRFNEVIVTEGERPAQYTQENAPDAAGYDAHLRDIAARSIVYDDGLNAQNQPIGNLDGFGPYATATAPRMGDTVTGLTGVLDYQWSGNSGSGATWRVRAVEDGSNTFERVNERTTAPEDVGGTLKVGSLNVLNFFATLDENGNTTANGMEPRGANSAAEFERQADKLVNAILALDADVLGLLELENDFLPGSSGNAVEQLVVRLNAVAGADTWAWVDPGTQFVGGDAIGVGFIYRTEAVRIAGGTSVAILDDSDVSADLLAQSTVGGIFNGENTSRAALAVTFEEIATGADFTASINHFKSKGGAGEGADADRLDGAGAWNSQRLLAAQALDAWLATNPTGSGDSDRIILGDLNSYAREAPVQYLVDQGYENLQQRDPGSYSYVFDGQTGSLDQVLTSASLSAQVTGVTEWHINSDEADALDYNLDFGRDPAIFDAAIPVRVSDHDPILIGLNLRPENAAPVLNTGILTLGTGTPLATLTTGLVVASDDTTPAAELVFTLDREPFYGEVLLNGTALEAGGSFTGQDLAEGQVAYLAAAGMATADSFGITVTDAEGATASAGIAVSLPGFDNVQTTPLWGGYWGAIGGRNFLQGTDRADIMTGGLGDDVILGGGGNDTIFGALGNDRILGGDGRDFITGDLGDDWIEGGAGADTIYAGLGDDVLTGGAGDGDILSGDFGRDTYVFRRGDGHDIVQGLNAREGDIIDLRDFAAVLGGVSSWDALRAIPGKVESPRWGGDTVLHLTDTDSLTIRWTNVSQLNEGDFLFV